MSSSTTIAARALRSSRGKDATNRAVGGAEAPAFAAPSLGADEPNDVPARAQSLTDQTTGTIAIEGDVDWYLFTTDGDVQVQVSPAAAYSSRPQNLDPVVTVYDSALRMIGEADEEGAGIVERLAADLSAGSYYVAVRSANGAADARPYTVSYAQSRFHPWQDTYVGSKAEAVAVGDVTSDGREDVLLTTGYDGRPGHDFKLLLFAQNADGSLAEPVKYDSSLANGGGAGVAVLDADADQRLDVALATSSGVEIYAQNDSGTLVRQPVLADTGDADYLVAKDLDDDGDTDLVVASSNGIFSLAQESDGSFTKSMVSPDSAREVEVGDVDGDGEFDVAAIPFATTLGVVHVYSRAAHGWSRAEHNTVSGDSGTVRGIEVADLSGDGRDDIAATAGQVGPKLNVFVQQESGELAAPAVYETASDPDRVEAADIDGDQRVDLVVPHARQGTLSVFPQQADGSLGTPVTEDLVDASVYNTQGLALGDINGDQKVDAVLAGATVGLVALRNSTGTRQPGEQHWIRSVSPADFSGNVVLSADVTVAFEREIDASSVTTDSVRLVDGGTGEPVPGALAYDSASKTVTFTPSSALRERHAYRLEVGAVRDSGGASHERFTTTFSTVDAPPPAVSGFTAMGRYKAATVRWSAPQADDFSEVVVRMASGGTAPASPDSGTLVYRGTGSAKYVTGLAAGKTYSFAIWARDRGGNYSPAVAKRLIGTAVTASTSASTINYGSSVKISGKLARVYVGSAIAGQPVKVYSRRKGTTTWYLLSTRTTTSSGTYSYTHKPTATREYYVRFDGSTAYMGATSPVRTVTVKR